MSVVATPSRTVRVPAPEPVERRHRTRLRDHVLPVFTKLVIAYLLLPIAVMILYSFNANSAASTATAPKVSFRWQGFTASWWKQWNAVPDLTTALRNSIEIAVTSMVVATALGTLVALALVRYRFRGQRPLEQTMFLNIAAPEIVLGAGLLAFYAMLNVPRGLVTIFVAHVMFNIAFVAVTVRARLAGFGRELEEAAQDLYAGPVETFLKVTLPLIWPGIVAGALLAFALSIDDFVITNFVAGQTVTFPLWVFGAVKVGIPPQVFVLGTAIFAVGLIVAVLNVAAARRGRQPPTGHGPTLAATPSWSDPGMSKRPASVAHQDFGTNS